MRISDFDFELPPELIAQEGLPERNSSRMLVVDRASGKFSDSWFADLPGLLSPGDVLVLNNTKVFPARLFGRTDTGSNVEIFLVEEMDPGLWECLARPARRLRKGKRISFDSRLSAEVVDNIGEGRVSIRFESSGEELMHILDEIGRTPLPPYIKRDASTIDEDRERYQTVFAKQRGAIAAPTAGLHFTPEILEAIRQRGVTIAEITLHVGYGTFEPVRSEDIASHTVSPEKYEIGDDEAELLNTAKREGRRIIAIGTTTTRALESNLNEYPIFTAGRRLASLTITPGYSFRAVTSLITNFHLPMSSLLILTSTFGGHELIMNAYRHAVAERYRFYSYGDCMFIV